MSDFPAVGLLRFTIAVTFFTPAALLAQDAPATDSAITPSTQASEQAGEEQVVVDIWFRPKPGQINSPGEEECKREQEAASITGEIVVCAAYKDDSEFRLSSGSQKRYAEETMLKGAPRNPDFILDCADQGWPPGCVRLGAASPPPLIIDIKALPEAPPGSDAERLGRGLPPNDNATPPREPGVQSAPSSAESAEPEARP